MKFSNKKLKATSFFAPYIEPGKCTLRSTGKGVYLIKLDNKIVYVGKSLGDIKGTIYRHFQKWNDRRADYNKKMQIFDRVTYYGMNLTRFKIKVIFCPTDAETDLLEQVLILKIKPRDNTQKFAFFTIMESMQINTKLENIEPWKESSEENPF